MGLFDFFLGSTKDVQTYTGADAPMRSLRGIAERRMGQIFNDPTSSEDFQARRKALRDLASVQISDAERNIDQQLEGRVGEAGKFRLKQEARQEIGKQVSQGEREGLSEVVQGNMGNMLQMFALMSQDLRKKEAIEAGSIRQEHEAGLFDFTDRLFGTINKGKSAFSPS
jgi:hypothetical protein